MAQLNKWMTGGKISKLVIVITSKETGENVERWQFDVCFFYLHFCFPPPFFHFVLLLSSTLLARVLPFICVSSALQYWLIDVDDMNGKVNEEEGKKRKNIRRTPKAKNNTTKRSKYSTNHPLLPPPARNPSHLLPTPPQPQQPQRPPPPAAPSPTKTLPQPSHNNSKKNPKRKSKKKSNRYSDKSPPR